MSDLTGVTFALLAAVFWGSYLVPMKRQKTYDPFFFQLLMGLSIAITSAAIALSLRTVSFSALVVLAGLMWAAGNITSLIAVKRSSLAKVVPIAAGTVIVTSFLLGMLFLKEPLTHPSIAIAGAVALVAGITLTSLTQSNAVNSQDDGTIWAVVAGLFFGSYIVPFKLSGVSPMTALFPLSLSILAGALIIFAIKKPRIQTSIIVPGVFSGAIWNMGNLASLFTIERLGIAIGFPLTQLTILVAVGWGLLYFREIKGKANITKIAVGAVIVFAGATLLTLAK